MQAKDLEVGQKFTLAPSGVYICINATGIKASWPVNVTPKHVWAIDENFFIHTIHPDISVEAHEDRVLPWALKPRHSRVV